MSKKGAAELSVAEEALRVLVGHPDEHKNIQISHNVMMTESCLSPDDIARNCIDSSLIVFIDIENIPQAVDMTYRTPVTTSVVGIVGHCHSMADKQFPFYKYIVRSALKDAADHALTFIAGFTAGVINENMAFPDVDPPIERPVFIVLSRDHYAEATCWCIKQQGFEAIHLTTMSDLLKYFDNK
jgi:hypothetical protein